MGSLSWGVVWVESAGIKCPDLCWSPTRTPEERAARDPATHPSTSMPRPLPTPGMSFAYNLPCLLPSEEEAPLCLSSRPRFIWVWHPWNTSPPHFETKKLLLHYHPEAPGERPCRLVPKR